MNSFPINKAQAENRTQNNPVSYQKFLTLIRSKINQGTLRVHQFVRYQKILTNWTVGKILDEYLRHSEGKHTSETKLMKRLKFRKLRGKT
ncbi:MAG: hypothetical protein ABIJ41_03170 [Candidatus Omnitrophota bacterium]